MCIAGSGTDTRSCQHVDTGRCGPISRIQRLLACFDQQPEVGLVPNTMFSDDVPFRPARRLEPGACTGPVLPGSWACIRMRHQHLRHVSSTYIAVFVTTTTTTTTLAQILATGRAPGRHRSGCGRMKPPGDLRCLLPRNSPEARHRAFHWNRQGPVRQHTNAPLCSQFPREQMLQLRNKIRKERVSQEISETGAAPN